MWASLQKAGPPFLGSDIINSGLDARFCFKDFVAGTVLGISGMEMMGCIWDAKDDQKVKCIGLQPF